MQNKITVLSVPIDVVTMQEAISRIQKLYETPGFHLVATANAEMVMHARQDKELYNILTNASLVIPDGAGVLWAAEQHKLKFPERVAGCDLVVELLKEAVEKQTPVYCLGAAEGVAKQAISNIENRYGKLNIVGIHSGFFDQAEEREIVQAIEAGSAKLVLVALGVPKQEKWLIKNLAHLNGVVGIGIGGSFDVMAGNVARAPKWMQKNRLEWLYRLYKQPQRIYRMAALPRFMLAVWTNKNSEV